jgi:L-galactono-1,4-lactone dehydrogenase
VNQAEAAFWEASGGERIDDSTNILGFDCGGEQLVFEVCFPMGTLDDSVTGKDLNYVQSLLALVEKAGIPAPSPFEQRWTASSTSPMSPAYSDNPKEVFSWLGIIMYLPPSQTPEQRAKISARFREFCAMAQPLMDEYNAHAHWAKIELPTENLKHESSPQPPSSSSSFSAPMDDDYNDTSTNTISHMKRRIADKFPVDEFNAYRKAIDPNNILGNTLIDELFGSNAFEPNEKKK